MAKVKRIISIVLILAPIIFTFYFSRQIFYYRYEPEYYENWFYHSQWNYPGSTRGISDGELYKFVGYRLAEGENPFNINYEAPPLGKYLYGLAERYIGSPYWISISLYLLSVLVLAILLQELLKNYQVVLPGILLFITSPFVATQVKETMLDLPLMFMFLVHVFMFIKYLSNRKTSFLILSGIFLGLASGVKFAVYTPLIICLGLPLIFFTAKKVFNLILYLGSVFAGYVFSYFCYFIHHPNPIPWIRLHEKALKFYLGSDDKIDYLNQWKGIFLNSYQGWWQTNKITLGDWSFLLPVGVVAALVVFVWAISRKDKQWIYVSGVTIAFLIINTFVPFWPRYLMPIIPLFVLLVCFFFKKLKYLILLMVLLNIPFFVNSLVPKDHTGDSQAVARFISTRAYRELYRSIMPEERKNIPEQDFIDLNETFFRQLGTRFIEAEIEGETIKLKYITKYGELSHESILDFVKVNNQWKLNWKWEYLWPGFNAESKIIIKEKTIPLLKVEDKNEVTILKRGEGKVVYIIPRIMFDWSKYLNALAEITGEQSTEIDRRVKTVVPDHYPRFVGYLNPALGQEERNRALVIPGVTLEDVPYLVVDNSLLVGDIHGLIEAIRQKNPELFYVQAEGYIENKEGKRVLIPFKKFSQEDVIVKI